MASLAAGPEKTKVWQPEIWQISPWVYSDMSEFVANLAEVFAAFGRITTRRMFGGHGIYHDGLMFGLVVNEQLYLKADAVSRQQFLDLALPPFSYQRHGKPTRLSYFLAPEDIFDDPDAARHWAGLAFEASLRGRK